MTGHDNSRCGAKKSKGGLCRNRPVKGGNSGRCRFHGGASQNGPESSGWKHGRYAAVFKDELKQKYIDAASIEDPTDILPELAAQRAVFASFIGRLEEGRKLTASEIDSIIRWSETIGKMVERVVKMRNETMLTIAETLFLQAGIIRLLDEYIPDPDKRTTFITQLDALIPGRANSAVVIDAE